jgi:hypothetical protein
MSVIVTVRAEMEIEFERAEDASVFLTREEALREHLHSALWDTARDGGWLRSGTRSKIASLNVTTMPSSEL